MSKCFIGFLKIPNAIRFFNLGVYVFIARHRNTIDFCTNFLQPETMMDSLASFWTFVFIPQDFLCGQPSNGDGPLRTPVGTFSPALGERADISAPPAPHELRDSALLSVTPKKGWQL